jgi:hypothetical protein
MSDNRYVNVRKVESRFASLLAEADPPHALRRSLRDRFRGWLLRQPATPDLVSRKAAAEILGVKSPNLGQFIEQGRMPDPMEVEGSPTVSVRAEVEALAEELKAERAERDRKKEAAA